MSKTQPVPQCPMVRTYQRGSKWWFDVRIGGRRVRQPAGRTQAQAEVSWAQFVASGAQRRAPRTVGAIFDTWLAYQNNYGRKERTVSTTQNSAARLERYFGGDTLLVELDTDALAEIFLFTVWCMVVTNAFLMSTRSTAVGALCGSLRFQSVNTPRRCGPAHELQAIEDD